MLQEKNDLLQEEIKENEIKIDNLENGTLKLSIELVNTLKEDKNIDTLFTIFKSIND